METNGHGRANRSNDATGDGAVTIAIPTRDRPELVERTVRAAVEQTRPADRVVVVDNSRREAHRIEAICDSFGGAVEYLPVWQDLSFVENHQRALSTARTEFVAVLQDDDLYAPTFIERALAELTATPEAVLFAVNYAGIDIDDRRTTERAWADFPNGVVSSRDFLRNAIVDMSPVHLSAAVFRTAATAVTGFAEADGTCCDVGLVLRVAARGPVVMIDEPLSQIRIHSGSASSGQGWYAGLAETFRPLEWEVKTRFLDSQAGRLALGDELSAIRRDAARRLLREYAGPVRARRAPIRSRLHSARNAATVARALR